MTTHVYDGAPSGVTVSHYGAPGKGILGSEIIAASTGGTSGDGPLINDNLDPTKEYRWYLTSVPSSGVANATELGVFILTGAVDGIYTSTYRLVEDGVLLSGTGIITTAIGTDITPPALSGSIAITNITSTTYTATCPVATDAAGIAKYQYRLNGGSWIDIPPVSRIANVSGRTPGTTDTVEMRAADASNNFSSALSTTVNLSAADTTPPTFTGTLTVSNLTNTSYTITHGAASDANSPITYEYSLNGGSSYASAGTGLSFNVTGRTPSATDTILVRAKDPSNNASATLTTQITLLPPTDNTAPTFGGTLSISNLTDTSYDVTYSPATDANSPITYLYSFNNVNYTSVGTSLTINITGRAPNTTDMIYVVARDPSSNTSTPLSTSVTLLGSAPGVPSPPTALTVSNKTSTAYRVSFAASVSTVTSYKYSFNNSTWYDIGNALFVDISGRTPGAVDTFYLRAVNSSEESTSAYKVITLATGSVPGVVSAARTQVVPLDTPITVQETPATWTKDIADVLDYTMDWTNWLADCGDSCVDGTARIDTPNSGVVIAGQGFTDDAVTIMLSVGVVGTYRLVFCMTSAAGRYDERTIFLEIR